MNSQLQAVGVAGLGRMGRPIARRLAQAGMLSAVYNRTWATCHELATSLQVRACKTPSELAVACDILITVVSDEIALREVYEAEAGILQAIPAGRLCIEMGTSGIAPLESLAVMLGARGSSLIDAPVSGSVEMAQTGELTILAGGNSRLVTRAQPVFDRLAARTFHMGPLGSGQAMKLAVNNVIYGLNQSLGESLVLAERAGIDRLLAYEVFSNSAVAAPFVRYRRPLFEHPDQGPVQMRIELADKDLSLIEALAEQVGATLPQTGLNHHVLQEAITSGHGRRDVAAVAEHLRNLRPNE